MKNFKTNNYILTVPWACSFRVRQAARTDHRIGDTELRRAGGKSKNLGVQKIEVFLSLPCWLSQVQFYAWTKCSPALGMQL